MHRDPADDVLRPGLRVLHLDIEVVAAAENARINELVLKFLPRPRPVHGYQLVVGKFCLRVFVQPALVAVGREVVEVEVIFLDILAVISLGIRQPEQALFQDRVPLVPQRQRQAQPLLIVADPGEAVLTPPVGAGPGLIVAEIRPGVAVVAVILPDRAPLPLAQVRSPAAPGDTVPRLREPAFLRRQWSRRSGASRPHRRSPAPWRARDIRSQFAVPLPVCHLAACPPAVAPHFPDELTDSSLTGHFPLLLRLPGGWADRFQQGHVRKGPGRSGRRTPHDGQRQP